MTSPTVPAIYRGSVKDVIAPIPTHSSEGRVLQAAVFRYTDAFSVFDWGKMPDALPGKGAALAILAASLFEKIESPVTWRDFSKSPEALALRRGIGLLPYEAEPHARLTPTLSIGSALNEVGEKLQSVGLRTHYLGVYEGDSVPEFPKEPLKSVGLAQLVRPPHEIRHLVVRNVEVVRPVFKKVLGRQIPDYSGTRAAAGPKLIPLEVVFRFSCPPGSSLIERARKEPGFLAHLPLPKGALESGINEESRFEFPILECFSKLEPSDRFVSMGEAIAISGLRPEELQGLLLRSAWVAAFLKARAAACGLELADGKLEWALDADGELLLVDAIGPDELRLLAEGAQLSKEFLRQYYRPLPWYAQVQEAKTQAQRSGSMEWKRWVALPAPPLGKREKELASHLYPALTNALTGKRWFPEAWDLKKVVEGIRALEGGSSC